MNPIALIADCTAAVLAAGDEFPDLTAGRCRGMGTQFFYADRGENMTRTRAICNACPVQVPCREWGIRHEHFGVWGGLTERARRVERSRRGIRCEAPDAEPWFNPIVGFTTQRHVA
jgi:hypothetical protein